MLALFHLCLALAADPVSQAERVRLSEDLKQLAMREAWSGAESTFERLQALGVALTFDDLYRGACAARALGDAQAAYDRLRGAAALDPRRDVVDWLYAIDNNYGKVTLIAEQPRKVTLEVDAVPFDPAERVAVQAAQERVAAQGSFAGLLPRGSYVFAGHAFSVEPGVSQHISVAARGKKQEEP